MGLDGTLARAPHPGAHLTSTQQAAARSAVWAGLAPPGRGPGGGARGAPAPQPSTGPALSSPGSSITPRAPRTSQLPWEEGRAGGTRPLRGCRNFGSEECSDGLPATRAGEAGPRAPEAGPPPTERAAEGRAGTVRGAPTSQSAAQPAPPRARFRVGPRDHPRDRPPGRSVGGAAGPGGLLFAGSTGPCRPRSPSCCPGARR